MKRITINGNATTVTKCLECGQHLTKDEYITCTNMCKYCYSKFGVRTYISNDGTNSVDKILENMVRER